VIIGTTAGVVSLIGTAFTLIQQIQKAKDNIKGAPKALVFLSTELGATVQSLNLVKEKAAL
jgi:hypothetical protein